MSHEQKRILILEDSDIFADMLMGVFDSSDYILERAVNGFEGIKKVYSFLPHIIITDIEMPLFKGYQVTRLLKSRKNTKMIPIIMFTSLDETKDKFWGDQAGADYYMKKSPENLPVLLEVVKNILLSPQNIDFDIIEKESKKITDESIIEIVNNLLDNKLFQTTVIGLLTDLSSKVNSLDKVVYGIFDLFNTVCRTEIITLLIHGKNRVLYIYTANFSEYNKETTDNLISVCISDFGRLFQDTIFSTKKTKYFIPEGNNNKKILSYIWIPLTVGGEIFASVHIANSLNEYFSPGVMENINVFAAAASPIIANALLMHELAELQNNTRTAFARYVPADVMDEIINESSKKVTVSENKNISVLFCDIRNFTELSEHSDPQIVVDFLNNFFEKMGIEIISEGGHIDKFIGDAIMAVFGAFQNTENSPSNAIRAAVKMLGALNSINYDGSSFYKEIVDIGIGINYGECILGNIGFKNKMDYTIIGDTVNLASRIESLTKSYRHRIIVSEFVYEETKEKFLYRKIDNVLVKGKKKPVGIYAVYSGFHGADGNKLRSGDTSDLISVPSLLIDRDVLINYNKGLQVFYMREWKLALEYFTKALEHQNDDFLSNLYLERTKKFMANPPNDNWNGVFSLAEK
ncbi:MAG: response regulator [Treponema sp.]|nr:response regulator [Treponema sp.]